MTFAQRLDRTAALFDSHIETLLAAETARDSGPEAIPPRLSLALRHAALGGGKRLRPFLTIECAALFGLPPEASLHAAAAIECVHCYSLAHDDLPSMDNDEVRRGRPSVWKAFDEWTAVLAGDALLTLAFELLARTETHPDPAVRIELVSGLAQAAGAAGMVGGQCLDLEAEKMSSQEPADAAEIHRIHRLKTAALIAFSCEAGAILGGGRGDQRRALRDFGEALGLAFQMADDILDAEGDAATVGKRVAKDAAAGKATLVSLAGIEAARLELVRIQANALAVLDPFGAAADPLRDAARFAAKRER
jgi:farnesyl diphosphate synthase